MYVALPASGHSRGAVRAGPGLPPLSRGEPIASRQREAPAVPNGHRLQGAASSSPAADGSQRRRGCSAAASPPQRAGERLPASGDVWACGSSLCRSPPPPSATTPAATPCRRVYPSPGPRPLAGSSVARGWGRGSCWRGGQPPAPISRGAASALARGGGGPAGSPLPWTEPQGCCCPTPGGAAGPRDDTGRLNPTLRPSSLPLLAAAGPVPTPRRSGDTGAAAAALLCACLSATQRDCCCAREPACQNTAGRPGTCMAHSPPAAAPQGGRAGRARGAAPSLPPLDNITSASPQPARPARRHRHRRHRHRRHRHRRPVASGSTCRSRSADVALRSRGPARPPPRQVGRGNGRTPSAASHAAGEVTLCLYALEFLTKWHKKWVAWWYGLTHHRQWSLEAQLCTSSTRACGGACPAPRTRGMLQPCYPSGAAQAARVGRCVCWRPPVLLWQMARPPCLYT